MLSVTILVPFPIGFQYCHAVTDKYGDAVRGYWEVEEARKLNAEIEFASVFRKVRLESHQPASQSGNDSSIRFAARVSGLYTLTPSSETERSWISFHAS